MTRPINITEYHAAAREALPQMAYDYYAGGALDEVTLGRNESAYDELRLQYRVLRDVSNIDLTTTILGERVDFPVFVAPTAFHQMAHPDGEVATARAAGKAGTIMTLSTLSNRPVEEVVAASSGPVWFQLYVYKDRGATKELVARAQEAGCKAIVLTVDAPVLGTRERDVRNRFTLHGDMAATNLVGDPDLETDGLDPSELAAYVMNMFDASLTWEVVGWLAGITDLPLVVKGIVHPDDARLAVEHGASGVVVSNHGGRQLDTSPATIEVLPEIVEAVDGKLEVLLDGGIRRGTDVVKAVALGARAVAVGRPVLWGLATSGQEGVEHVLSILKSELEVALALCGATHVGDIAPELVMPRRA